MDLDRLRALVTVVEEGTLSRAGKTLGHTPKALRKRIVELEEQVGVKLIAGSGRGLTWTPAARLMAARGKALLRRRDALLARIRRGDEDEEELAGEFRLAYRSGAHPGALAFVARHILQRFPRVRLHAQPTDDPMALLPDRADFAAFLGPRPRAGPWLSTMIQRSDERVFASREYIARRGPVERLEDLHAHTLLSWDPPDGEADRWPLRDGGSVKVRSALVSPDAGMLRRAMLDGTGIARLPGMPPPELVEIEDDIVEVLPELLGRDVRFTVVMPDTPKMRRYYRLILGAARALYLEYQA